MNMAIGAAAPSTAVANLLGSLAVLLSILFGGFLLSSKQMPNVVSWMAQLSFVRYYSHFVWACMSCLLINLGSVFGTDVFEMEDARFCWHIA